MDANDAYKLNEQIQNIQANNENFHNALNKQTIHNHQLTDRINNITEHINTQQEKIGIFINKNANKIKNIEDIIQEQQYLNQINYNIDQNHLTEIAETVTLAKLNIISKSILNPNELDEIFRIINTQSIDIISTEHLYELLKLQAYYNSSNIILNIRIPVLSPNTYDLYHLILLPINETMEINTKPYILYNEQKIQYLTQICPEIENMYFCEESQSQESTNQSQCIGNIMNNKEADCPMNNVGKRQNIQQIDNNNILMINVPETLIQSNCRNKSFHVTETVLIRFKNCSVQINDISYDDTSDEFWDQIYILPLTQQKIRSNSTTEVLSLHKLQHQNIKHEEIMIQTQTTIVNNKIITYTAITILSVLTTISILIIRRRKITNFIIRDDNTAPTTSKSLWPSLYTKGGAVNSVNPPSKPPRLYHSDTNIC